ncbi:hypothetical protein LP421_26230 [Rhizobium sp. RCAM05350]|nr:hypothetical protein LP421_26230 [Rhizobium sp. RCAM05350]
MRLDLNGFKKGANPSSVILALVAGIQPRRVGAVNVYSIERLSPAPKDLGAGSL